MTDPFQLVTNCTFKGKDYLVRICVFNSKKLEITVTDKLMAEDWQCEYDASYIEALTHKTGNYKHFDIFVMMLKSGLLKTSDSITLDLLTFDDLEQLRCKKILNPRSHCGSLNKRYLILTYSVEFDRIHYPLPLDYCGPPDPSILQNNIRKLEAEVERLKSRNNSSFNQCDSKESKKLQGRVEQLSKENEVLTNEIRRLSRSLSRKNKSMRNNIILQNTLKKLEEQVLQERNHFNHTFWKLKDENKRLKVQIEELKNSERCLKLKLKNATKHVITKPSKKNLPEDLSPEPVLRKPSRERSESQLTCRPISSWNSTTILKQNKDPVKNLPSRSQSRSSSESNVEKKLILDKNQKKPADRIRNDSNDRMQIIQCEISRPCRRKEKSKRDSSNDSNGITKIRSRSSSLSSRKSSKHSTMSYHSSHGSGDRLQTKRKHTSKKSKMGKEDLKFSMSDLETRIHALQKLLSEGLNF